MLVLLYYFSQNPDFSESVKPLMEKLKNSEQMLNFLKDLSAFTDTFSNFKPQTTEKAPPKPNSDQTCEKKSDDCKGCKTNPQSPTKGIADDFIQNMLDSYLKKQS